MKKLLSGVVLVVLACVACADSFYWGLGENTGLNVEFSYAKLMVLNGKTEVAVGNTLILSGSSTVAATELPSASADLFAATSGNYFYVEYLNSNYDTVAVSQLLAMSAAQSHISDGTTAPLSGAWYAVLSAVPEPSSGLLMLLGLAGLALRRKRV